MVYVTTDAEHIESLTYAMACLDGDRHQGRSHVPGVQAAIVAYEQAVAERDRLQGEAESARWEAEHAHRTWTHQ